MENQTKIWVPTIIDDPLAGRSSSPTSILGSLDFMRLFSDIDYILIKDGKIDYKSEQEPKPKVKIELDEIRKILLIKKVVTCWRRDHKIDFWPRGRGNTEVALLLKNGERRILIPGFFLGYGKKQWDKFLKKLCDATGLPLEEILENPEKR